MKAKGTIWKMGPLYKFRKNQIFMYGRRKRNFKIWEWGREALVAATKETGLEVNAHKTKYMTVSRDQNAGRIHSVKIDNSSIERVEEFK